MASPVLPNPSNFLAVALVLNRSRDGPSFVFHYPASVLPVSSPSQGHDAVAEAFEGDDDILLERLSQPASFDAPSSSLPHTAYLKHWNRDDHLVTDSGSQVVPWENVAGFPTRDLASILTPSRQYHKKAFQVSLDPLYCVSYPIHVPESGNWKKRKKAYKSKPWKAADDLVAPLDTDPAHKNGETTHSSLVGQAEKPDEDKPQLEDGDDKDDKRSSMTMFNLVFILNPKKHEVKTLVNTLYFNIVRKINKAYKYTQQHSDFVWKESKRILQLKEKGREERR
jgi:nitrogen permease regulator 3-like protein